MAEEAARLLAVLGARAATPPPDASERGSPAPDSPAPDSPAPDSPAPDSPAPDSGPDSGPDNVQGCEHQPRAGEALTCALCPICQGIALIRELHPETVDRLADLAMAAALALRDLAGQVSAGAPAYGDSTRTAPRGGRPSRASQSTRRVDIDVVGEDEEMPS